MMATVDRNAAARPHAWDEWRVVYEWFAGWRWEQHRGGVIVDECLASFETEEQCLADVRRRRAAERAQQAREGQTRQDHRERLAA